MMANKNDAEAKRFHHRALTCADDDALHAPIEAERKDASDRAKRLRKDTWKSFRSFAAFAADPINIGLQRVC
jgi:hypothetical protein